MLLSRTPIDPNSIWRDGSRTLTADWLVGGFRIRDLGAPTANGDAATKLYVDTAIAAIPASIFWKDAVRVATLAPLVATRVGNILTATGVGDINLIGIDGVTTLVNTDRVLVKNQGTAADNGFYTITDIGSAGTPYILTRSTDADTSAEMKSGVACLVQEGTQADTSWTLSTNNPITLNVTGLAFVQVGSAYVLPIYVVGLAGSGPNGSSPQFATIAAAVAQYITDGHTAGVIHLMEGAHTWTGTLPPGLSIRGPVHPFVQNCAVTGDISITAAGKHALVDFIHLGTVLVGTGGAVAITVVFHNYVGFAQTLTYPSVGNFNTGTSFTLRNSGFSTRDGGTAQHAFSCDAACNIDGEHVSFNAPDTHASIYLNASGSTVQLVHSRLRGYILTNNAATIHLTNTYETLQGALTSNFVASAAGTNLYIHGWFRYDGAAANAKYLNGGGTLRVDPGVFLGNLQTASLQNPTNSGALAWVTDGKNENGTLAAGTGVLAVWDVGAAAWVPYGNSLHFASEANGDILYFNGTDWIRLGVGAAAEVLTVVAGIPAWAPAAGGGGGVQRAPLAGKADSIQVGPAFDVMGRFYYDPSEWTYSGKAFYWQAIFGSADNATTVTIKFYNVTTGNYIEIDGIAQVTLTATSSTPALYSASFLASAPPANFTPGSACMIEIHAFTAGVATVNQLSMAQLVVK